MMGSLLAAAGLFRARQERTTIGERAGARVDCDRAMSTTLGGLRSVGAG